MNDLNTKNQLNGNINNIMELFKYTNTIQNQMFSNYTQVNNSIVNLINFIQAQISNSLGTVNQQNTQKIPSIIEASSAPIAQIFTCPNTDLKEFYDNKEAKAKFLALKEQNTKKMFNVIYMYKNKMKKFYRIDCMTRKINVSLYHFIKESRKKYNVDDEILKGLKYNIRFTSKSKFRELDKKFPLFKSIYEEYLKSDRYKRLLSSVKAKYDDEYLKIFFRHSKNFISFHLYDNDNNMKNEEENESSKDENNLLENYSNDIEEPLDSNEVLH